MLLGSAKCGINLIADIRDVHTLRRPFAAICLLLLITEQQLSGCQRVLGYQAEQNGRAGARSRQ